MLTPCCGSVKDKRTTWLGSLKRRLRLAVEVEVAVEVAVAVAVASRLLRPRLTQHFQQRPDSGERPILPYSQLLPQLVESFFQELRVEEQLQLGAARGQERRALRCLEPGGEEGRRRPGGPEPEPRLRGAALALAHRRRIAQRQRGDQVERPQHRGHVAQRRALAAALRQRLLGVLPEIHHREVLARPEHVLEAVFTVDTRALGGEPGVEQELEAREELLLLREQLLLQLGVAALEARALELPHHLAGEVPLGLVDGALVVRAVRLGRERRVGREQRPVELGGAPPEEPRRRQRAAQKL